MKQTRTTAAKSAILELLSTSEVALSHTEIQKEIGSICDRVTIYRVLDRLTDEDVIHKVITFDGTAKYAKCHHDDHAHVHIHDHVHFSCDVCQEVSCLEGVKPTYKLPPNYTVGAVNFTLSGTCPKCKKTD